MHLSRRATASALLFTLVFAFSACKTEVPTSPGVRGWVVDAQTGKPIAGVKVTADDATGRVTATDDEGRFRLPPAYNEETRMPGVFDAADATRNQLPPLNLRFSADGYELLLTSTDRMSSYEPVRLKRLPTNLR